MAKKSLKNQTFSIAKEIPVGRGKFRKAPFGNQRRTVLAYHTICGRKRSSKNLKLQRQPERLAN
jgi:hypothetical protein